MEGGARVYSHLEKKVVWGHQALGALVSDGDTALCYKLERCGKTEGGKIEQAAQIAASLPGAKQPAYALMDSWYTCKKLIDAFRAKGYHTIGALKTNRIIYPDGKRMSISMLASHIQRSDASLVTGVDNAIVLISYPEKSFGNANALCAYLCTDVSLDAHHFAVLSESLGN
jgi:hypothetical protein